MGKVAMQIPSISTSRAVSVLGERTGDGGRSIRLLTIWRAQFPTPRPSQAGKTRGLAAFSERH